MNFIKKQIKGLAGVLTLTCLFVAFPCEGFSQQTKSASVTLIQGRAQVIKPGGRRIKIRKGSSVYEGDKIKVNPGARVLLKFVTDSVCQLNDAGVFSIDKISKNQDGNQTKISMQFGSIKAKIQKLSKGANRFELATPTAVAGVRGTEFEASATADEMNLKVLSGVVEVKPSSGDGASQKVGAGEGCSVKKGESEVKVVQYKTAEKSSSSGSPSSSSSGTAIQTGSEDFISPVIAVTYPLSSEVFEKTLKLRFVVVEDHPERVTVNGRRVNVSDNGSVEESITLSRGFNTITIEAIDKSGNRTSERISVTYTPMPPQPPR